MAATQPPSGTVTFLFTDIEGSTRRWEADSPAMGVAVERHLALLREVIEANGGVLFKVVGDAIQAAFATAPAGLTAAITAQRALCAVGPDDPSALRVRMALHTGEAVPTNGDYLAPCLNRLSRLLGTGYGGQLLLSEASQHLVRDHLPPDVQLRDLGTHALRDLREPERVFQVVAPGLPATFPPLESLSPVRHMLPLQLTPFIGRERELAELAHHLRQESVRLVTLVGPGGVGKTRLALQAATNAADTYVDGVRFVSLAAISDAERVIPTVAQSLGLQDLANQDPFEVLVEYLRRKHLLLVLDNTEQVSEISPLVSRLLAACPQLQVLATGRAPLRIAGEQEVLVPSLTLPSSAELTSVDAALRSDAVRLFVTRAQAVKANFVLTDANVRPVVDICRRLDGLPLAIELAAARVKLLDPEALLRRLNHRLALLTGGGRDLPARQRTLRDTIAWSYELLSPSDQSLFARLAAFAGPWTLEAAAAVAGNGDDPALDVLDGVSSLLDKSLVRSDERAVAAAPADPRFGMLQTIHEFATECLVASGDEGHARAAHAAWYQQRGREASPHLSGPAAASWLDRLDLDHEDLRAALAWLSQEGAADAAVSLSAALWRFWWARGYTTEGRTLLTAALALDPATPTSTRAEALDGAGVLAEIQGDYAHARALHEAALATARACDDRRGVARALANLGVVTIDQGNTHAAEALLEESLALARVADDPSLTATILNDLGWVSNLRGDTERSESLHQESLALRRRIGNPVEIARSLNNLGILAYERDDYPRARRLFEESLERCTEAGDRWGRAGVLNSLAEAARGEGARERALALYEESHALFEAIGDARSMATVLRSLAAMKREAHDLEGAGAAYREALGIDERLDARPGIVAALAGLGGIAAERGDANTATLLLGAATALAEQHQLDLASIDAPHVHDDIAALRTTMGDKPFAAAWSKGQTTSLDEVINAAASGNDGRDPPSS